MEDLLKQILEEQKKTNELLKTQNKDPNELLTIKQIHEETGIGTNMIQKMFNDPELPVQKYTSPFKVTRQAFNNYINVKHDYLRSVKEWKQMKMSKKERQAFIERSKDNISKYSIYSM